MPRRTDPLLTLHDKSGVLYVRLYQRIRALILQGAWPPGMRLPSSRLLAADLGISRNTAAQALDQLLADGLVETRSRAGTFVSADAALLANARPSPATARSRTSARPPVPFAMAHGAIDAFPIDRWTRLQARVWAKFVPDLLYEGDPAGDHGLREAIAGVIAPTLGIGAGPEDVMIFGGTVSALDLVAATLPAESAVVVEDPGYHFIDAVFRSRGHSIVPVPVDLEGLDVERARTLCPSPALIVVGSAAQFPLGVPLSDDRRRALLRWASTSGALIVDDAFDASARFDGQAPARPLLADSPDGRVIVTCSLSRMLFRSLRLGFMIAPPAIRQAMVDARMAADGFEPLPNQIVLREFIDRGLWSAHQRACRTLYRERRAALIELLEPYRGTLFDASLNPCGLHLVLHPLEHGSGEVAEALRAKGIACTTLAELTRGTPGRDGVLLGFAAYSPDVIEATRPALAAALGQLD